MNTCVDGQRPCSSARVEKPSRTGIIRSRTTMSGWSTSATFTHSSPSLATTTSAPYCWKALRYSRRMSDSSSQIRTLTLPTVRNVPLPRYGLNGLVRARAVLLNRPVLLNRVDRPEVHGQLRVGHVRVGHRAVALLPPTPAPRVAHGEALGGVVVADGDDGMAADLPLLRPWHADDTGARHLVALEALVDGEAEDERRSCRETGLKGVQLLGHTSVHDRLVLERLLVTAGAGPVPEGGDVVGPGVLGADAELGHTLDAIAEHGAGVDVDGALHRALVEVDEQS